MFARPRAWVVCGLCTWTSWSTTTPGSGEATESRRKSPSKPECESAGRGQRRLFGGSRWKQRNIAILQVGLISLCRLASLSPSHVYGVRIFGWRSPARYKLTRENSPATTSLSRLVLDAAVAFDRLPVQSSMDRSYHVADPSDWLKTPVAPLGPVEAALRCQVCKDFYNTPMITSCSHTFCSLCIRRCLTTDGKCPSCRASDQELRLRRNWVVEELVDAFKTARPIILQLGHDLVGAKGSRSPPPQKRKLSDTDFGDDRPSSTSPRKTRSQSRRSPKPIREEDDHLGLSPNLEGANLETGIIPLSTANAPAYNWADDDLAACPICSQRMKVEDVFSHLDTCQDSKDMHEPQRTKGPPARLEISP